MNIVDGSPKGMTSVTMQYVQWLQKKFSRHQFTIFSVCHDLKRLEENEKAFREVIKEVEAAEGVLWAFPLYYMLVHAHYKRFIELLFERGAQPAFFDRGFSMNHVPIFRDKQVVWLVAGPLAQLASLRQILEGYMDCQRANLVSIVTDERADSSRLDRLLDCLSARLAASAAAGTWLQTPFSEWPGGGSSVTKYGPICAWSSRPIIATTARVGFMTSRARV